MNAPTRFPTTETPEAIDRLALDLEFARRRKLNNIPDHFMTPTWLELAIAKDWSMIGGKPSPVRERAEREAREALTAGGCRRVGL